MAEYIQIAVNVPRVQGVFDYHLPPELEGRLRPGHLVLAPFGPRLVQGVVLGTVAQPQVPETKAIDMLLDEQPVLTAQQLDLARHLSESCLAPLAACVSLMLPSGIGKLADVEYALTEEGEAFAGELSAGQARLHALLKERGALRGGQINRALPRKNWRSSGAALVNKGLAKTTALPPMPSARAKTVRTVEFVAAPADEKMLSKQATPRARRAKILEVLQREPGPMDADWLYAESQGSLADLHVLEELGFVRLSARESVRDPLAELAYDPSLPPHLTADQARVWDEVHKALANAQLNEVPKPILLHGVTGSGKTEIYLQAVAKALTQGKQAIVLVPEIALTPQTVRRILSRFPDQVGLLHSELSPGERYDTWRRARAGQISVVVGPRSALFAPLDRLGLIVVDEEHDDSYYEGEQMPHYHAREAAVAYARLAGAVCLLGSATPDVGSYSRTQRGGWQLLELPARILAHRDTARAHRERLGQAARYQAANEDAQALELPPVNIVDMRRELKAGNRSIFSRELQAALTETLEHRQQAILFLNRRGTATYVFCRDCGFVLRCPNCDNPLTQHLDSRSDKLLCHHCGYTRQTPKRCPNCDSVQIRHYRSGTVSVEAEVQRLFPKTRTLRWERSSTRTKGAHERILRDFGQHEADVLIGTQMLAKGLDLPLVTMVGVVLADVGLNMPDYRASERVFQVLTQVAGRAGRSPLGGRVVLQTFQPDHFAIQAAAKHDYAAFFTQESQDRRQLRYPPFAQLVRLEYRDANERKAEREARAVGERLAAMLRGRQATEMTGPVPAFFSRLRREYRWQIVLRGQQPAELIRELKLPNWRVEVDPPSLL